MIRTLNGARRPTVSLSVGTREFIQMSLDGYPTHNIKNESEKWFRGAKEIRNW